MRLFVAIPFSEKFSNYMKDLQEKLPEAKMRNNGHFHITLQFLGEVKTQQIDAIKEQLNKIQFKPFKLALEKLDVFKNKKGYIKVVWAGLTFPDELKDLQKQVEDNLDKLGFVLDKPFSPHITLARVKFTNDKKFEEGLKQIELDSLEENIDKIILYESTLTPDGPEYKELLTVNASS